MSSMNIQGYDSDSDIRVSASGSRSGSAAVASADPDSVDIFLRALEGKERGDGSEIGAGTHGHGEGAALPLPDIACPLDSLFAGRMDSVSSVLVPAALSEIDMDALVERILVSAPEAGSQEVRITLAGSTLGGTEIVLQRDSLGQLAVILLTTDDAVFQTLVAAQHELKQRLDDVESHAVRVNVDMGGEERNDHERRSRGFMDQEYNEA